MGMTKRASAKVGRDGLVQIKGPYGEIRTLSTTDVREMVSGGEGGKTAAKAAVNIIKEVAGELAKSHTTASVDEVLEQVSSNKEGSGGRIR